MNIAVTAWLWKFLVSHQVVIALLASWTFSAYASTVLPPPPLSGRFHLMWYTIVHKVAGNLDRFKGY